MGVKEIFDELVKGGYSHKDAAREAQARTGDSLVTRRPIRTRGPKHKTDKWMLGEYD